MKNIKYMKILNQDEIMEIYMLLKRLDETFKDMDCERDIDIADKFGDDNYPLIHKLYYKTIWNSLSIEQRKEILEEDFTYKTYGKYN